jgi:glycine/D-amino acid oxidase-like deaminating enzyme
MAVLHHSCASLYSTALAEKTNNAFGMSRRGYAFFTAQAGREAELLRRAQQHTDATGTPNHVFTSAASTSAYRKSPLGNVVPKDLHGVDVLLGADTVRSVFPYVAPGTTAVLHARRCGWVSAHAMGAVMLEQAQEAGAELVRGRVVGLETVNGRVDSCRVFVNEDKCDVLVKCGAFINSAGPWVNEVASLVGQPALPVENELVGKTIMQDSDSLLPLTSEPIPMMFWTDPVKIDWPAEVVEGLRGSPHALCVSRRASTHMNAPHTQTQTHTQTHTRIL